MKTVFSIAFWVFCLCPVFAVFQYEAGNYMGLETGTFVFTEDASFSIDIKQGSVKNFGYYDISSGAKVSADKSGQLGSFKAGDKIGIWIEQKNGKIYTSTHTVFGEFSGSSSPNQKDEPYHLGSVTSQGGNNSGWDYTVSFTPGNTPSGQPLPGILAALAVGGAIGAGVKFKKHLKK